MHTQESLSSLLRDLAQKLRNDTADWFAKLDQYTSALLLIEAARVMDVRHLHYLHGDSEQRNEIPMQDLVMRGWNPLLAKLLPQLPKAGGIPIQESTANSRNLVTTLLKDMGTIALLDKLAEMAYHGFLSGEVTDKKWRLKTTINADSDHFLDQIEHNRYGRTFGDEASVPIFESLNLDDEKIDGLMEALVFPFDTGHGRMVGYDADPALDMHFINRICGRVLEWRTEAGIHPDVKTKNGDGNLVTALTLMLVSFYIKHIHFIGIGMRMLENVNYPMSITIWKKPEDLISSISAFCDIDETLVSKVLRGLLITRDDSEFFKNEQNPLFPLLIEISPGYWLAPVSGVFRNPMHVARRLTEHRFPDSQQAFRQPRERWMTRNLYALFMGARYVRLPQSIRLRLNGETLTDIDAAIYDVLTGELALFQLKWQDFDTGVLNKIRSKGKRFTQSVDDWARKIDLYMESLGIVELCKCLRLKTPKEPNDISIFLFALGQTAARFGSYGYELQNAKVAPCIWSQFTRLRYEVGPSTHVISEIHSRAIAEKCRRIVRTPIPFEISVGETHIHLEDVWCVYDEDKEIA